MPKHKRTNFKILVQNVFAQTQKKELEAEKPENKEIEDEESEDKETEDEVLDDRRVRRQEAEKVSDKEIKGDINLKEKKRIKERSFVWLYFEKITDDKNVIWAKCKYCR